MITGSTLKYFDMADEPGSPPEMIYEGLGYLDLAIMPHWDSKDYGHVIGAIEGKLRGDGYETVRLTDEEYLLIEDGKILNR